MVGAGLWLRPHTAASAQRPFKPKEPDYGEGTLSTGPGAPPPLCGCWGDRLTSAVGKKGTAARSSSATWVCMAVSERWKTVSACTRRDHGPTVRFHSPAAPLPQLHLRSHPCLWPFPPAGTFPSPPGSLRAAGSSCFLLLKV